MMRLIDKIRCRTAIVGIIGLGYVGLPLAVAFSKKFNVIGYDTNEEIVRMLTEGKSHIADVTNDEIAECLNKSFYPTSSIEKLSQCDFKLICVPTPLTKEKVPDLSYIKASSEMLSRVLKKGQFIILESTTFPGTTEEVVIPILEKSGLKATKDFGVAYSPERIDPGNKNFALEDVPKVVGGVNHECTDIAAMLYGCVINSVIKVNDAKTAEAVKMLENIFRHVNIALINELSLLFEMMDINAWEVIDAASTKPYGFMAFSPGPGVGGHCIPLDPFYLYFKAQRYGFMPRFIELSAEINEFMKIHVVNLIEAGLRKFNKGIPGAKIAIMGLAYKKNIADVRESPSIKIIDEIVDLGANVRVYDPYAKMIRTNKGIFYSEADISNALKDMDCAVFIVDHNAFKNIDLIELSHIMAHPLIIDCKNIFKKMDGIHYIGLGKNRLASNYSNFDGVNLHEEVYEVQKG